MPKIGPTGEHQFGKPLDPYDRGGLNVGFRCIKEMRQCVMQFGTVVDLLCSGHKEMTEISAQLRSQVIETWGLMPYYKNQLPLKVSIVHGNMVEIVFPVSMEMLVCNPELILALCEVIEDRIRDAGLNRPTQ